MSTSSNPSSSLTPSRRMELKNPLLESRQRSEARSGSGASASKYWRTWRMVGRTAGEEWEQSKPSLRSNSSCEGWKLEPNLGSTVLRMLPLVQEEKTQSVNMKSSASSCCSIGLLPQATSRRNAPNAYTSVFVVALPVLMCSGARYLLSKLY